MEAKSKKPFSPKGGKKLTQKGKDSIGAKLGGKPGGKKPFKPYNNTERKGRPWKGGDGDKKQQKFAFSKAGNGPQKRKLPHFKGKNEEDGGEGPVAKRTKKGEFKPKSKELSKEDLKKNRQQRKKDLKNNRQQAERKDMKNCDSDLKKKLMKELHDLIRGKIKQMAFAHDSVRVLQCFIQFGSHEQRQETFEELKDDVIGLCKSQYGRHVVKKLLMYGNKELVAAVMQTFKGHVKSMLRHAAASSIIEYAYNDKAVLAQRLMLTEELYGNTFTICKDMALRRKELLEVLSPPLLEYLHDNAATMVTDKATSVTVSDILASACGDLQPAMTAVAQLANQELLPGGISGQLHMAEHPAGHLVLKWLIEQDMTLAEAGKEERFGRILVDTVGTDNLKSWIKVNRGAMVLCSLLNSCDKSVAAEVKTALESIKSELSSMSNNKGAEILLENLNK
ncbi:Pumilio -like protein 3 [Collichthys lucidus]|uniref:Pumilio-like protein 3 n=1 Tax=Collichthys lucidus TaxID=240159 RepID=A0A4U5VBC2_COLLU|nr:Pumilio -like protein 3 [Collichthys lucidus]